MMTPQPANEGERLKALQDYGVLDTAPEAAFDDLTKLAAQICQVPTAMISLVDETRQWFKARVGIPVTETPREVSFCAHTILNPDEVMEVEDATKDPRFAASPLVTSGQNVRFYAGAPLVTPGGQAVGTLCVMDGKPHALTAEQREALRTLGRHVVAQLELGRKTRELAAVEAETRRLLTVGEKSRRALLSLLEDQKQAETALRSSEERFRQIAGSIHEVFWLRDIEKAQMLYVSPAYEKIWGRTCESLYESMVSWSESIHPDDRERVRAAAAIERQLSGAYDETFRIIRPDGGLRWVHARAFPVKDADGVVRRVAGVAADITAERQLEEKFLRAQRLEAIGSLSSGIAHDLNNILAPMLMIVPLLRDSLPDKRDVELLTMVEQGAQRGANIIKQLLTFSRGIAGERGLVQPRHLLTEMCSLMRETFPREIAIANDAAAGLWDVTADATQLHQVLLNLCVNARDAQPKGGSIKLKARNTRLSESDRHLSPDVNPGAYVVISVEDSGAGIPPEILGRIFEPFFTTKDIGHGTGLGLSTVLGIVKSHGGFINVYSEPGKGTRFDVYLPASVQGGAVAAAANTGRAAQGNDELILVVDDEEPVREVTRRILTQNHYAVMCASNGKEGMALFIAHRHRIRLLLTDVMMPVMGGIALIQAARALEPRLRVIATSGLTDQERADELTAMGVGQILSKPCDPRDILDAVHRELQKVV